MTNKYKLYLYDVWGNPNDGYELNDIYAATITLDGSPFNVSSVVIELPENATDYRINRALKCRGITWENLGEDDYHGYIKRNGKPFGELRLINEDNN